MKAESSKDHCDYSVNRTTLVIGMLITLLGSLSIHVVMLQIIGVPFPDFSGVSPWAPMVNTALAVLAVIYFYTLARPQIARFSLAARCLIIFVVFAMLKESVRGILMNAVVTEDWKFDIVSGLPSLTSAFVLASLAVVIEPLLRAFWMKLAAATSIAVFVMLVVRPLLHSLFAPVLKATAPLEHADVYAFPYGWQVLVPAYLTYAEPVVACTIIAALTWKALSTNAAIRLLQFVLLILLMRGMLLPTFVYSFYDKLPLASAMVSESQFLFETIAMATLTALVWQLSIRPRQSLGFPLPPAIVG